MVKIMKFISMLELKLHRGVIAELAIITSFLEKHQDAVHHLNILLYLDLVCLIRSTYLEILRAL
jgi:hypothetical protein